MTKKDPILERILKRLEPTMDEQIARIQDGDRKILTDKSPRHTAERLWREMNSKEQAAEYENQLRLYNLENQLPDDTVVGWDAIKNTLGVSRSTAFRRRKALERAGVILRYRKSGQESQSTASGLYIASNIL